MRLNSGFLTDMDEQTEINEKFIPGNAFTRWLVIFAGGVFFLSVADFFAGIGIFPAVQMLAGVAIKQAGTDSFSAVSDEQNRSIMIKFLIRLVFVFMLVPAVFYYSFGRWTDFQSGELRNVSLKSAYAGLIMTFVFMITLSYTGWVSFFAAERAGKKFTVEMFTDYAENSLLVSLQEKGLDLRMRTAGNVRALAGMSLADLNRGLTGKVLRLSDQAAEFHDKNNIPHRNDFLLVNGGNDTTWHLILISDIKADNPGFLNADGKRGYLQKTLEITPSGQRILNLTGS